MNMHDMQMQEGASSETGVGTSTGEGRQWEAELGPAAPSPWGPPCLRILEHWDHEHKELQDCRKEPGAGSMCIRALCAHWLMEKGAGRAHGRNRSLQSKSIL